MNIWKKGLKLEYFTPSALASLGMPIRATDTLLLCRLTLLHDASFLPRPIAIFLYPSFVVLPLSFG